MSFKPFKDICGERFGRWTALARDPRPDANSQYRWFCVCECGTERSVSLDSMRKGESTSCGCKRLDTKRAQSLRRLGQHKTISSKRYTYSSWKSMKDRCLNERNKFYGLYGGRGIRICDEWVTDFERFVADMGPRPYGLTLDRRDHEGNYCRENCRWASITEQNENRSATILSQSKVLEIRSSTDDAQTLAKKYGVSSFTIKRVRQRKSWAHVH